MLIIASEEQFGLVDGCDSDYLVAKDEVEAHKIYDKITLGWRNNWSEVLLREQTSE